MKWFRLADFAPVWSACAQLGDKRPAYSYKTTVSRLVRTSRQCQEHLTASESAKRQALQTLRHYRGVREPRASGCLFCRFPLRSIRHFEIEEIFRDHLSRLIADLGAKSMRAFARSRPLRCTQLLHGVLGHRYRPLAGSFLRLHGV